MDKNLLIMTEMPQYFVSLADKNFNTFKLWTKENEDHYLSEIKTEVDAIAVMGGYKITPELMKGMPNLKIIACYGVGYDAIDINCAKSLGIKVTNTPEVLNDEVADTAIALMLCVYKKIVAADNFARNNSWAKGEFPLTKKFTGTKLGIVGMGRIGKAIAKRAEAFDCEISYHSRNKKDVKYKYYSDLNALAKDVDTLCVITPGGKETEKLINKEILSSLGKNGVLVNVARGSVIDQDELIHFLENNLILAAGLDVYINEPNIPSELINLENTVLLPHIASGTVETRNAMGQLVFDNIENYFQNKPLISEVT
jgi:lactate dehydrogenase-like 2-hydroxyacid dehydrogenase|tara:strand:- start:4853 stop:5788 length:936 start_codon:yes stop_codon:yes gene_type:complete